jgi:integrase
MNTSSLGILNMSVRYIWQPRGNNTTVYYRKRIPNDLRHHYKTPFKVVSTKVKNKSAAIKAILKINSAVEQEWKNFRANPNSSVIKRAITYLEEEASYDAVNHQEFYSGAKRDHFESVANKLPYEVYVKIQQLSMSNSDYDRHDALMAAIKHHLDPHEYRSIEITLKGKIELYASDYIDTYAELKGLGHDSKQIKDAERAITQMTEFLGNRMPHEYKRNDINKFILARLNTGASTGTVKKYLNLINAVFNKVNDEHEIDYVHRFNKPNIPNLGDDRKERDDFTPEQLNTLRDKLSGSKNTVDHLIMLALETGMRGGEVLGLASEDIYLDETYPYIRLHQNTHRRLKTKNSTRIIPLIGLALEATQSLDLTREWLFPHYLSKDKKSFKNTNASNVINKRIKKLLDDAKAPTAYSFRHTMQTRLRNVECPADIREEICGWKSSISKNYGSPTDIKIKANYMRETLTNYC